MWFALAPSVAAASSDAAAIVAKSDDVEASTRALADADPVPKSETVVDAVSVVKPREWKRTEPAGGWGSSVVKEATPDSPATLNEFVARSCA